MEGTDDRRGGSSALDQHRRHRSRRDQGQYTLRVRVRATRRGMRVGATRRVVLAVRSRASIRPQTRTSGKWLARATNPTYATAIRSAGGRSPPPGIVELTGYATVIDRQSNDRSLRRPTGVGDPRVRVPRSITLGLERQHSMRSLIFRKAHNYIPRGPVSGAGVRSGVEPRSAQGRQDRSDGRTSRRAAGATPTKPVMLKARRRWTPLSGMQPQRGPTERSTPRTVHRSRRPGVLRDRRRLGPSRIDANGAHTVR